MRNKLLIGICALAFLVIISSVFVLRGRKERPIAPQVKSAQVTSVPIPTFSCDYDLRLSDASKKLHSEAAINILKQNCEWLMDNFTENFDGNNDLVFITAGAGCGSCHAQRIYILSNDKVIYSEDLDDPSVDTAKVKRMNTLVIRQPIRKDNEPYGDPSQWFEKTYLWNVTTKAFDKYSETTGFYPTPTP